MPPPHLSMFIFALDTCARAGELRALQAHHFTLYGNNDGTVLFEDSGGKRRLTSVPLTTRAYAIAQKYSKTEGRIFKINAKQVIALFNEAKTALGLDHRTRLTWHCTRHTCATRLVEANESLAKIMEFGGWKTLKAVKRYLHIKVDALHSCTRALESY